MDAAFDAQEFCPGDDALAPTKVMTCAAATATQTARGRVLESCTARPPALRTRASTTRCSALR